GLDHHLARRAADLDVGEHVLVRPVGVVYVVRRVLEVTDELAGLRPDRQHARRVQAVQAFARPRIVGLGVAGAPIDQVELRIVRAGAPRGPAAPRPRVAVARPGLRTRLARLGNGVATP